MTHPSAANPGESLPAEPSPEDVIAFLQATKGELNEKLGVDLVEASTERVVATMPVEGNRQPYGLLHGGATAALAETCGSVLAAINAGPARIAVGIDLNVTHHRSATSGAVTATASRLSAGRSVVASEVVVVDDAGRRLATARLTCLLRDAR